MALPQEPLVLLNGVCLNDDVRYSLDVSSYESLMKEATRRPPAVRQTYGRNQRVLPQVDAYLERQVRLLVEILRCEDWLTKQKLRGALVAACSKLPNKLQVGALVCEPTLTEVAIPDRQDIHLPDRGTVELVGDVHDATWKRVYNQCAGDPAAGAIPGFIVRDDRPDHASLKGTGNPIAITNPGSASTYLVAQFSNASYANTAVYIRSNHKDSDSRIVVTLDAAGVGEIEEAHGLLLPPGAQSIYFEDSGGTALASGTWAMGWNETEWRFLGDDGGHMDECPAVFELQRTGSATYVSTAGTLTTATDSQARVGLPYVARRNLFASSTNFGAAAWTASGTLTRTVAGKGPFGTYDAWTLTDGDGAAAAYVQQALPSAAVGSDWFSDSIYVLQGSAANILSLYILFLPSSTAALVQVDSATGTTQTISGTATVAVDTVTGVDGSTWYRIKVSKQGTGAGDTEVRCRIYPAVASVLGGPTNNALTGSVTVWNGQLDRASAASPPQVTDASGVDMSHVVNGGGHVFEVNTTNLLLNPGFETGTTAGWSGVTAGVTVTTGAKQSGSYGLRINDTSGAGTEQATQTVSGSAGTWYSLSASGKVVSGSGASIYLDFLDGGGARIEVWTETFMGAYWDRKAISKQAPTGTAQIKVWVYSGTSVVGETYIDDLLLEALPFPTSPPPAPADAVTNATRNADSCATARQHNLFRYSENFAQCTLSPTTTGPWVRLSDTAAPVSNSDIAPNGTLTADTLNFTANTSSALYYQRLTSINGASPASGTVTFSVWLKGNGGIAAVFIRIIDQTTGTIGSDVTCTLSATEWRRFTVTATAGSTVTAIGGALRASGGIGTFLAWGAQLVEGSFAGPYVRTTDTPVLPDDADRTVPKGWDQNGGIEWYTSGNPGDVGSLGVSGGWHFLGAGDPASSVMGDVRVYRYPWNSGTGYVKIKRATNLGGGSHAPDVPGASVLYDGGRHKQCLEWQNYWAIDPATGLFRRYMWLYYWIDGILKYSIDVAAVYGATSWTTLDRFWLSDGRTQATISQIRLYFPPLPAGAVVDVS